MIPSLLKGNDLGCCISDLNPAGLHGRTGVYRYRSPIAERWQNARLTPLPAIGDPPLI